MIDFHSHVLPGIDDGSRDLDESIALLKMLRDQRISTVVATPHFYAEHVSVDDFLRRRDRAYDALEAVREEGMPSIIRGAEVRYYTGISRMEDLPRLCIENTDMLLLEMPSLKWTDYILGELVSISSRGDMTLVIAHMDRYMEYQSSKVLDGLYNSGILIQCNASMFSGFSSKRKALSMLKNGEMHFIGSDCHNLTSRAPHIGEAYDLVEKKLGSDFLRHFTAFGNKMLKK